MRKETITRQSASLVSRADEFLLISDALMKDVNSELAFCEFFLFWRSADFVGFYQPWKIYYDEKSGNIYRFLDNSIGCECAAEREGERNKFG